MSTYDDPNREAVGLAPIWTGAEGEPPRRKVTTEFDPPAHTVAEVEDYLAANPDDEKRVVKAERAGKNRATIVDTG